MKAKKVTRRKIATRPKKADFDRNQTALLYLINRCRVVPSRIRLQKLVCLTEFLHGKNSPFDFGFKSYYYGPYSEELRSTIDRLVGGGQVDERVVFWEKNGGETTFSYDYSLTPRGKNVLQQCVGQLNGQEKAIDAVLSEFGKSPNVAIIKAAKEASGMESIS